MVRVKHENTTMTVRRRPIVCMAMLTVAMLFGTLAQAVVLTFDGAICGGGTCGNSSIIDQTYGDIPGQLDVVYTGRREGGNGPVHFPDLRWWNTQYSDLVNVVWGAPNDTQGVAEIALLPAPGFQVTLNGFDLGSWPNFSRTTQYTIYDSAYTPLVSSGTITIDGSVHTHVPMNLTHAQGLIIQWGPSGFNVGIDNVDFTVTPVTSTTPRHTTGQLPLQYTKIKTVTADATAPALITLPACPTQVAVFSPTTLNCPATVCTIEASVTSEVSDVTPGADSIRFYLSVDGAVSGVFPSTNFGVHSTAKSRQIESATASWMRNAVTTGAHTLEVKGCVANTTSSDGATAFAGDRILTMRVYKGR